MMGLKILEEARPAYINIAWIKKYVVHICTSLNVGGGAGGCGAKYSFKFLPQSELVSKCHKKEI
jgi:hypothetical protein